MTFRIIISILTVIVFVTLLVLSVLALTIPSVPTFAITLVIAAGFGFFLYRDFKFFFGTKK